MKSEIKLRIIGTQKDFEGEENTIELVTEGKLYRKDGADYITYEESEISGMENSRTRLKLEKDRVQMKRMGQSSSDMVFCKGQNHALDYRTPYGIFKMEIATDSLEVEIREEIVGSTVDISYTLTMVDSDSSTENKLKIEII